MNRAVSVKRRISLCVLASVLLAQGCSKEPAQDQKSASPNDAKSIPKVQSEAPKQQVKTVPAADKSVPLESYAVLNSGKQLMFAFLAVDSMPLNYEKVAGFLSQDYRSQADEFKKRDILSALKPVIDAEVAKAKKGGYFYMTINDSLESYNFEAKSFAHTGFDDGSFRYFFDLGQYKLKFSNSDKYRSIKVVDEVLAREIESLRSKGANLETAVYFYINSTEIGSDFAIAEITKIRIKDKTGRTLVEI
jgi:hypothetical protein